MPKTAIEILEEEAEWAVDTVLYGTLDHFSENMGSFPATGFGLKFVQRSAEKQIVKRVEKDLVPVIEAHLAVQVDVVEALADGEDRETVREEFEAELLDTNPLWEALDGDEARDDLVSADLDACETAAVWVQEAGDREFESFADLTYQLGRTPEEAVAEIRPLIEYLPDLLEQYRDDLDMAAYSSILSSKKLRDWFIDTLINGLEKSQKTALDELETRVQDYADAE